MSRKDAYFVIGAALASCVGGALVFVGASSGNGEARPPAAPAIATSEVADAAPRSGHDVYEAQCSICHDPGAGHLGTMRLTALHGAEQGVLLERDGDGLDDLVKYVVRHGQFAMPPFRKTEISDAELDALAAYVARKR